MTINLSIDFNQRNHGYKRLNSGMSNSIQMMNKKGSNMQDASLSPSIAEHYRPEKVTDQNDNRNDLISIYNHLNIPFDDDTPKPSFKLIPSNDERPDLEFD